VIHPSAIEMQSFARYLLENFKEFGKALSGQNLWTCCNRATVPLAGGGSPGRRSDKSQRVVRAQRGEGFAGADQPSRSGASTPISRMVRRTS